MLFGMKNAPLTCVTLISSVFWPLIKKQVVVYLDDIIFFKGSKAQHILDLRDVLKILRNSQLNSKLSKCQSYEKSLIFLEHIISNSGINSYPKKIKSILKLPCPTYIDLGCNYS